MRASTNTIRSGVVVLCLSVAAVVTACGGDDDTSSSTSAPATTMPASPTTEATGDTAAPGDTGTTAPAATTPPATAPAPTTTAAATTTTIDTNTLASRSGCTPGAGALPDGEWYGLIADASATAIEFDLACWFTGDPAITASAEDGAESPPPNDYYVRNTNPALRTVPVAGTALVTWYPSIGDPTSEATIDYSTWVVDRVTRGVALQPGVWITVAGSSVTAIEEQWVP